MEFSCDNTITIKFGTYQKKEHCQFNNLDKIKWLDENSTNFKSEEWLCETHKALISFKSIEIAGK